MPPGRRPNDPSDRVPTPSTTAGVRAGTFVVDLPAGGRLDLQSADEVVMWNETRDRYVRDYRLSKTNDLIQLGAILSQVVALYRAQTDLANPKKAAEAQAMISKSASEIRAMEKSLGIDKATREKGGTQNVADYITRLKRAAYQKGVHISDRVKRYEALCMEARWKIRLLRNGDAEDRAYHNLSDKTIVDWLDRQLAELEELDKKWAKEKAAIWVGKL